MTTHYKRHVAALAFERNAGKLRIELSLGTPRRHLDVLVELLQALLEETGGTLLTAQYRAELAELREQVARRHHLRVVQ